MKTVIDAVNEFKGEINTGCTAFVCNQSPGSINGWYNDTFVDLATPQWTPLCCAKEFNDLVSQMETNFGKCEQNYSDYKFDYKLSHEPAQTYTQAMADNGELPSVGMECELSEGFNGFDKGSVLKVYSHDVSSNDNCVLAGALMKDVSGGVQAFEFHIKYLKPLTPLIELIDGKAYQFECGRNTRLGFFNGKGFIGGVHSYWELSACTNIQPLTVEVK